MELYVHRRAEWFFNDAVGCIDCRRRRVLRRLVFALASHRLARPGVPVPRDQLIAMVWAGESIIQESAYNRLRVAVNALRKWLGRGVETVGADYRLATWVQVRFQELSPAQESPALSVTEPERVVSSA